MDLRFRRDEEDNASTHSSFSSTPTETTPLILNRLPSDKDEQSTWMSEYFWLIKNCIPIVFTLLLQNSLQLASIFTLGRMGPTELAAAALASMFASVTAWSVAFGTATALDTLCSQAWTGAKDKTLVGIHLQRAICILAVLFIPIAIVWWNCTDLLLKLNQEPELALHAGKFLRCLMFGAPAFIAFEATKKYLQAQGIMQASTRVLMIVSPFNLLLNYTLVYLPPFKLGFIGAPIATSISYWMMLTLLVCYINFVNGKAAWGGWSRECLVGWWPFLKLSIPSLLMVTAEWWAFGSSSLAASCLGTDNLSAQSLILTTVSATYTIPFGISIAASNRIGNSLGGGFAMQARRAMLVAMTFAIFYGCVNSTIFMAIRFKFGYFLTSDQKVVEVITKVMPLCVLFQVADGITGICGGVIRGIGRQLFAAWVNIICYYIISLPIGYYLTFTLGWGLRGVWVGLSLALFSVGTCYIIYLSSINWFDEVRVAQERIQKDEDKIHEDIQEFSH